MKLRMSRSFGWFVATSLLALFEYDLEIITCDHLDHATLGNLFCLFVAVLLSPSDVSY
jgi:hypothetical protein